MSSKNLNLAPFHTDPYIGRINKEVVWILDSDIKALSSLVSIMLNCYRGLGDFEEFSNTIERLRSNINDTRWQRKITYFQIIAKLGNEWSETVGEKEVKKLFPIDNETDPEIFQLCIHFLPAEIPFTAKNDLLDKQISILKTPSEVLQYKMAKALNYSINRDDEKAILIIEEALKEYESTDWMNDNTYAKYQRAGALNVLGYIKNSQDLKNKGLQAYIELLDCKDWNESGIASIYYEIGNCFFHLKKYLEAIDYYISSLAKRDSELVKIFLAQAYCRNGDEKAVDIIQNIDESKLKSSGKLDLIFEYVAIGIKFKNDEMIKKSIPMLKSIHILEPIFEERRSKLLVLIAEYLTYGINDKKRSAIAALIEKVLSFASRYIICHPNICGFGVNINNILDDITKKIK